MKRIISFVLISLALTTCTSVAVDDEKDEYGSIHGIVTDADKGEPVRAANVSLLPSGVSTVTGDDGRYEFVNVSPGQYTLQVIKNEFDTNSKQVTVSGGKVSTGDIVLKKTVAKMKLSDASLTFTSSISTMSFDIQNVGSSGNLNWSISKNDSWISVNPTTGQTPVGGKTAVAVTIDRKQLSDNVSSSITVSNTANGTSLSLPIHVMVEKQYTSLKLSVSSLDFGSSVSNLSFYVMNEGNAPMSWSISTSVSWLSVNPSSGTTAAGERTAVSVTIDRALLPENAATTLIVKDNTKDASLSLSITTSKPTSKLSVSPSTLAFGQNENTLKFDILSEGELPLEWGITKTANWFSVSPTSGTTASGSRAEVTVSIDRSQFSSDVSSIITIKNKTTLQEVSVAVSASAKSTKIEVPGGLVSYYTFDAENANDATENEVHGTLINNPSFISETPSQIGKAIFLNAVTNQSINIPYNVLKGHIRYSVTFWIKDFGPGLIFSAMYDSDRVYNDFPRLIALSEGKFRFFSNYDSGNYTNPFSYLYNPIQASGWHHVAVCCDNTIRYLYIDGVLVDNNERSTEDSDCTRISIGGNGNGKYAITSSMKLDNIRFYTRSLPKEDVLLIYNSEK